MITAQKNGIQRNFGEDQWNNMPKDKFGWRVIDPGNQTQQAVVNTDIIQKKMTDGKVVDATKAVPDEITKTYSSKIDVLKDIPEIKSKAGRPKNDMGNNK